jgi:hypothetical protein
MVLISEEEEKLAEANRLDYQSFMYSKYGYKYIHDLIEQGIYPFDKDVDPVRLKNTKPSNSNTSKHIQWFELTTTHPDRNIERKNNMMQALQKYFAATKLEAHFEIGSKGLYHYHIKIGTYKYLRNCEFVGPKATHMPAQRLTEIQDGYRYTFQKVNSLQAFDKYINKKPESIIGWEDIL